MKELTVNVAGVPESQFDSVIEVNVELTVEEVQNRLAFLEKVDNTEYRQFHYTYNLLAPEVWAQYKLLGLFGTPEQVRLREQRNALRRIWKKKYGRAAKAAEAAAAAEATAALEDAGEGDSSGEPI